MNRALALGAAMLATSLAFGQDKAPAIAAQVCDTIFFLQTVVNKLSTINADSFVQTVTQLGTSFQPALVYGSKFNGNRDGGGQVRTEDYSAGCQCLSYRGPPYYGD